MRLQRVKTVFVKQWKDTLKNKAVLIQFFLLPIMTVFMSSFIQDEDIEATFFVKMFGAMYIGMAPLVTAASIIAEEKETDTLRMLLFSNVKASEYLLGIGSYVCIFCTLGSLIIASMGNYTASEFSIFLLLSILGIIITYIMGACVGIASKNQMNATSRVMPLMLVFAFLPMLSMFNDTIELIGKFAYTQQINLMFNHLSITAFSLETGIVLFGSLFITIAIFMFLYRKKQTLL